MTKREAQEERARLQKLLDDYEEGRRDRAGDDRAGLNGEATPDRADKVRARIARLEQLIVGRDQA